jgi:hypothetical protein
VGPRGETPIVTVAGIAAYRPGGRSRLLYRLIVSIV